MTRRKPKNPHNAEPMRMARITADLPNLNKAVGKNKVELYHWSKPALIGRFPTEKDAERYAMGRYGRKVKKVR